MSALRKLLGPRGSFFGYESSQSLSLFRFLYCVLNAVTLAVYATDWDKAFDNREYFATPLFGIISPDPIPFEWFQWARWICVAALVLGAIGVLTRPALLVAAVTFFVYEGTHLGFTKPKDSEYVYHLTNLTVFFLVILATAPGADRHGLLSIVRRRNSAISIPEWPRKAMLGMFAFAYFGAGWQRLVANPLWVDGNTLQAYLLDKAMRYDLPWGFELAQHWWLCVVVSVFTMALELTYVVALFFPRTKPVYLASGLMLHFMILKTMNINFFEWFAYNYLVLVDWEWLQRIGARVRGTTFVPAVPPAPATAVPLAHRVTCVGWILVQVVCVFGGIEAWPFSDFRVFRARRNPDKVSVLFFKHEKDGEVVLMPWRKQQLYRRALSSSPEREVREALQLEEPERSEALDLLLREEFVPALARVDPGALSKPGGVMVFQKRAVRDPETSGFEIVEEYALTIANPGG